MAVKTPKPNSLYNKYSRYVGGGESETANGFLEWWERSVFEKEDSDTFYRVETFYVNRLDLIAALFYGEPRWWWIIAQYNSILDPFSEITEGMTLRIPAKSRLSLMVATRQGGSKSRKKPVETISPLII